MRADPQMSEDVVASLNNKNPDVKQQTATVIAEPTGPDPQFLARTVRVHAASFGKPLIKVFCPVLVRHRLLCVI